LQNIRNRYRIRLNADNELSAVPLSHAASDRAHNNSLTYDQEATLARHPFSLTEAFVDFIPARNSRCARADEEVFADNMRFVWDDEIRFNGFKRMLKLPVGEQGSAVDTSSCAPGSTS